MIEEYDADGACVMSARWGQNNVMSSYRGYRAPWIGTPNTKPDVVACREENSRAGGETTAVYVSWNGATDVQAWKISAGQEEGKMRVVKTAPKNGFETRVEICGDKLDGGLVMAQAVGGPNDGKMSEAVPVGKGC